MRTCEVGPLVRVKRVLKFDLAELGVGRVGEGIDVEDGLAALIGDDRPAVSWRGKNYLRE